MRRGLFHHFGIGPAVMPGCPLRKRHADLIDHVALELAGRTLGQVEVLVVLSLLAPAGAVAEEPQMPGG